MTVIPRITSFTGEYAFLSNFYPSPITRGGIYYPTAEHFYQAYKSDSAEDWKRIASLKTPGQAKREGQKLVLRDNWDQIKRHLMKGIVFQKFIQNPELIQPLMRTGEAELVEGNTWGDTYWGVCDGKGLNMLGKILMEVREEMK